MEKLRTQVEHWRNINKYYLRGVDAEYAWADNTIAASRAYEKEEFALRQKVGQALLADEQAYIKITGDTRIAKALEKSGVTARRIKRARSAMVGRSKARSKAGVDAARDAAAIMFDEINRVKKSADRQAALSIGLEPERGPGPAKPVWDKGPSAFQQLTNIAISAGTAYLGAKAGQGKSGGENLGGGGTDIYTATDSGLAVGEARAWHSGLDAADPGIIVDTNQIAPGNFFEQLNWSDRTYNKYVYPTFSGLNETQSNQRTSLLRNRRRSR